MERCKKRDYLILGIDIGGTNVKFGVINEKYQIVERYSIPTQADKDDTQIVANIIRKSKEIFHEYPCERIGIGTPGKVDSLNGICIRAANLPYHHTPIVTMMEDAIGVDTFLSNDATCAICGEIYAGVGKKYSDFVMLTLGTGVGGGICINGRPYFGKDGTAGEFGHFTIKYDGKTCRCGRKGCYEQFASVSSLIRQTREAVEKNPKSLLAQVTKGGITGKSVFDAMHKGCKVAVEVIEQYTEYVAVGINDLARIFAPEAIVIGGAISNQQEYLLKPLREKVLFPIDLLTSQLKNDAGIVGAAVIAKEASFKNLNSSPSNALIAQITNVDYS